MKFKKGDIAVLIFSLILITASLILTFAYTHTGEKESYIEIVKDKNVVEKIQYTKLAEEKNIEIKTDIGIMKIHIDKSGAYVADTKCRDELCKKTGKITKPHQSIICLPQRIEITIKNENSSEFDTVNR